MITGLKSYLNKLVPVLGMSPDVLYERQRFLVKAGLLRSIEGRGPGSGVRANSESLAVFIASVLASDSNAETGQTARLLKLRPLPAKCPITQGTSFKAALRGFLSDPAKAAQVSRIVAIRPALSVTVFVGSPFSQQPVGYDLAGTSQSVSFTRTGIEEGPPVNNDRQIWVAAQINGTAILAMAGDLAMFEEAER